MHDTELEIQTGDAPPQRPYKAKYSAVFDAVKRIGIGNWFCVPQIDDTERHSMSLSLRRRCNKDGLGIKLSIYESEDGDTIVKRIG